MKNALIAALAKMNDAEATALYHAVAQWADNARNCFDETDDITSSERAQLAAAEAIEAAGDAYECSLAGA